MHSRRRILLCLFLGISLFATSQSSQQEKFEQSVYDICVEKPGTQKKIHETMGPHSSDLRLMNAFFNKAKDKNYGAGEGYAQKAIGMQFQSIGLVDLALIYFEKAQKSISEEMDPLGAQELKLYILKAAPTKNKQQLLSQLSELSDYFLTQRQLNLWIQSLLERAEVLLDMDETKEALVLLNRVIYDGTVLDKGEKERIQVLKLKALVQQQRYTEARTQIYPILNNKNKYALSTLLEIQRSLVECEKHIGTASLLVQYQSELDSLELLMARENLKVLGGKTEEYFNMVDEQDRDLADLKDNKSRTMVIGGILLLGLMAMILLNIYRQYLSDNEKKLLSLEQRMLRSQMNPHFIFNSLNSIKQFIVVNEKEKAVRYLNKFAKLMRKILDGSGKRETSLAEELETVDLYLKIENMRFSNEIEVNLKVDPSLNAELIKVPSLLLQPFLENAIWHGLSEKEGEKRIWIDVQRESDLRLRISVTDNGIGREMADLRKSKRSLKRKSVGLKNTRERLVHFAENYQKDFRLEFHDLEDSVGAAAGTQVVLRIPLV